MATEQALGLSTTADEPRAEVDARALPIPGPVAGVSPPRRGLPFAARFQALLIVIMFVGFALIAQTASKTLYQIGLPILVVAAFLQIAFGNIPPRADFVTSMKLLVLTWVIVGVVFVLSIYLAPALIDLGR